MNHHDDRSRPSGDAAASSPPPLVNELADLMVIIDNYAALIADHAAAAGNSALRFDAGALQGAVRDARALIERLRTTRDVEPRLAKAAESYLTPGDIDATALEPISRTIIVVEDDPTVRTLVARMLGRLGYATEATDDVEVALRRCAEPDVALLLCDVVMPGTSGPELVERVQAVNERLPILLMSGHFDGPVSSDDGRQAIGLLPKPFDLPTLKSAIEQALARVEPSPKGALEG